MTRLTDYVFNLDWGFYLFLMNNFKVKMYVQLFNETYKINGDQKKNNVVWNITVLGSCDSDKPTNSNILLNIKHFLFKKIFLVIVSNCYIGSSFDRIKALSGPSHVIQNIRQYKLNFIKLSLIKNIAKIVTKWKKLNFK